VVAAAEEYDGEDLRQRRHFRTLRVGGV